MAAKQFTLAEVKKHIDSTSSWIVIHNNVYDVTEFLNEVIIYALTYIFYNHTYIVLTIYSSFNLFLFVPYLSIIKIVHVPIGTLLKGPIILNYKAVVVRGVLFTMLV